MSIDSLLVDIKSPCHRKCCAELSLEMKRAHLLPTAETTHSVCRRVRRKWVLIRIADQLLTWHATPAAVSQASKEPLLQVILLP